MAPNAPHRIVFFRRPGLRAWLDASSPFAPILESRLESIAAIPPTFTPIATKNRMNKVWEGRLEGLPGPFILKTGWCNPVYSLRRRIDRRVNFAFTNRFLHSMETSFRLDELGIAATRPVLCWKKTVHLFPKEIGVLYPKIEASDSLFRYGAPTADGHFRFQNLPPETARAWGLHTRRMNEAGLLHVDPAPQNILLRPGAADPPAEADFIYIDIEAFCALPVRDPASPLGRWHRALAMNRGIRCFGPADLAAFCEGFALPSESPAAWIRFFTLQQRFPRLHPRAKFALLLHSVASFRP